MDSLNLRSHGVIEAHAGTGKTYTIVNRIVIPALMGEGMERTHIRDIMLVTYTEKAAGELKARIREGIAGAIRESSSGEPRPGVCAHLRDCLDNFHEAYIGTIHGVCLRLLQAYPFETGVHFSTSMVDDEDGLMQSLRESIRVEWPRWGINPSLLSLGGDPVRGSGLLERIIETAGACIDPDTMLCAHALGGDAQISDIAADLHRREELGASIGSLVREKMAALSDLAADPSGIDGKGVGYLQDILESWRKVAKRGSLEIAGELMGKGRTPDAMANKLLKGNRAAAANPLVEKACRAFSEVAGSPEFTEWKTLIDAKERLILAIILKSAPAARDRWIKRKQHEGLISFHDMLRLMHRAVHGNERFRRLVRARIRLAVIDEFQDTGVLQWEIFRRLFIEPASDTYSPRLFIAGDPKQSIYSFQNAVVESYLDARDCITAVSGSSSLGLRHNYRSVDKLVRACNAVFTSSTEDGFFMSQRIRYTGENAVGVPSRGEPGDTGDTCTGMNKDVADLLQRPFQIVPLAGTSAQERSGRYADHICRSIALLHGTSLFLPDGGGWKSVTLDYNHFAVIAESHRSADKYLSKLIDAGIPAAKYRQEGVFSSATAREWRTLLAAMAAVDDVDGLQTRASLTLFFSGHCESLESSGAQGYMAGVDSLFSGWRLMAQRRAWARLFRAIVHDSGVEERLAGLFDGERRLCDLRQVADYSLEYLVRDRGTLADLADHLADLERGDAKTGRDGNLYAQESDSHKVKVMTMHAAKGLEFPVCFVVTGQSRELRGGIRRWIAPIRHDKGESLRLHVMPVIPGGNREKGSEVEQYENIASEQQNRERRRLLYVALTRAQALLFVPMHLKENGNGGLWSAVPLPQRGADKDLTPILQGIADRIETGRDIDAQECMAVAKTLSCGGETQREEGAGEIAMREAAVSPDEAAAKVGRALLKLGLPGRLRVQTSYSALAHHELRDMADLSGRKTRETEYDVVTNPPSESQTLFLPPGKATGNALHELLELAPSVPGGLEWVKGGVVPQSLAYAADEICRLHGLCRCESADSVTKVVQNALSLTAAAFDMEYSIPGFDSVHLASLAPCDLRSEVEFHIDCRDGRLLGYIDLLFRVSNRDGTHRYFIIDWKSNFLEEYTHEMIAKSISESRYDLQARIYCHALDVFLSGIMGDAYDPQKNLGGALYVYLRGLRNGGNGQPTWFYRAQPASDRLIVAKHMSEFIHGWADHGV